MKANRREFLKDSAWMVGALVAADARGLMAGPAPRVTWPIGCFNRPWSKWPFDETIKAVKAAGYGITGLLTRTRMDPFISPDATPEDPWGIKSRLVAAGVTANMAALSSRHDIPLEKPTSPCGRRSTTRRISG